MVCLVLRNSRRDLLIRLIKKECMDFITGEISYIDKPLKWTSFDVVKRIRGVLLRRL